MKTKKTLAIIATSLVLAMGVYAVAGAVIGSVTPGGQAQVGNLTIAGKIVPTPYTVVYCGTNTPTITGVTNPNATIAFTINSTPVNFSTTTDENGNFSVTSPRLEDGQHEVRVVVTDQGGSTAETLIATINTGSESGLTSTGIMIAKIAMVALAIFMVLVAGYFALKKKEVNA